nr:hypothetical protein X990_139 [Burkholderia pseudomallei MSHR4868]
MNHRDNTEHECPAQLLYAGEVQYCVTLRRQPPLFFNIEIARVAAGRAFNAYSRNFRKGSPDLLQNENAKALESGWSKLRNVI